MATEFQNAINLSGSAIGISYQNKFLEKILVIMPALKLFLCAAL